MARSSSRSVLSAVERWKGGVWDISSPWERMWLLGAVTHVTIVAPCAVHGWAYLDEYAETEAGARTSRPHWACTARLVTRGSVRTGQCFQYFALLCSGVIVVHVNGTFP